MMEQLLLSQILNAMINNATQVFEWATTQQVIIMVFSVQVMTMINSQMQSYCCCCCYCYYLYRFDCSQHSYGDGKD